MITCDCQNWADTNARHRVLTGHHFQCPERHKSEIEGAIELIGRLMDGIDQVAQDCDGIPDYLFRPYCEACMVTGRPLPKMEENS